MTACETSGSSAQDPSVAERARMVQTQIAARDVRDERVLAAMRDVPRHLFVPADLRREAYDDRPLSIGYEQTISQPYIVALMTQLAAVKPTDRVLEVGTGSGYQAAVLSTLAAEVYTIELTEPLGQAAAERLTALGYANVRTRIGDGYGGWPDAAPFDAIVVTAAPEHVPGALIDQLKAGGRLVIPVGPTFDTQDLELIEKDADGHIHKRSVAPVRFVPLRRK